MKHLVTFKLFENVESQRNIEILADLIVNEITKKSCEEVREFIKEDKPYTFSINSLYDEDFIGALQTRKFELNGKGLSKSYRKLLEKNHLRIVFNKKTYEDYKGIYSGVNNEITIIIENDVVDGVITKVNKEIESSYVNHTIIHNIIKDGFLSRRSTIVHELQHAYEHWLSGGKYLDNNHRSASHKMQQGDYDDYYKLSHEISARFTQSVSKINPYMLKVKGWAEGDYHVVPLNWNNYLTAFKDNFIGWDLITDDERKRLISRLSNHYGDVKKIDDKSIDITDKVNILESELLNHCEELIIHYYHDNNYIRVYELLAKSEDDEKIAIERIVKLAETYRKTVGISPEKGHTGIKLGSFIRLLKDNGFVGNGGKFGTKKDYRFREYMIRYPKRKKRII